MLRIFLEIFDKNKIEFFIDISSGKDQKNINDVMSSIFSPDGHQIVLKINRKRFGYKEIIVTFVFQTLNIHIL